MSEPRTITLTSRGTAAAAVVTTLLLLLLTGQFVFIVQQRQIVAQQRDIATRQERRAAPVLDTTRALIGSGADVRRAAKDVGATLGDLDELMTAVRRTRVVEVTAGVLGSIRDEGLVGEITRTLQRAPDLVDAAQHGVAVLDRTYPTLRSSLHVQRDTRSLQRQAIDLQRQSLALTQELRDIARQTLGHAESLDRKTGGPLPPAG